MFNPTTKIQSDVPLLTWTTDLAIGHELVDADHQAIFETANRLQGEILALEKREYSIVGEVLVELIEQTGGHFEREEALMRAIRFLGYEEHKLHHKILMHEVNSLHRRFMDGHRNLSVEVAEFLQKWFVPHILSSDMELGRSIRADKDIALLERKLQ